MGTQSIRTAHTNKVEKNLHDLKMRLYELVLTRMFLVDKYGFLTKDKMILFHDKILKLLELMVQDDSVPHLIFYGPNGSGKKMIIDKFLEMLYGSNVRNTVDTNYKVSGSGTNTTDQLVKQSNFHIVIEPTGTNFDRYMIQDIVNVYAQKMPLQFINSKRNFKIVLINNADKLPFYAQATLRHTMEAYSHSCRFIMWSQTLSKVVDPLRSRCLCFRVTPPSDTNILTTIHTVACMEQIKITLLQISELIKTYHGNIKEVLWALDRYKHIGSAESFHQKMIKRVVSKMMECDLDGLKYIRDVFYRLMTTNVQNADIMKMVVDQLIDSDISESAMEKIVEKASLYVYRLVKSRRPIFQFDAFVVSIMKILYYDKKAGKRSNERVVSVD